MTAPNDLRSPGSLSGTSSSHVLLVGCWGSRKELVLSCPVPHGCYGEEKEIACTTNNAHTQIKEKKMGEEKQEENVPNP